MADDGHCRRRLVFGGGERTPESRLHAEHREEVGGDTAPEYLFGWTISGQVGSRTSGRRDIGEDAVLLAPVEVVGRGRGVPREPDVTGILPDHHEPVGLGQGQLAQEDRVHHGIDRRVGADPKRECADRDQGKTGERRMRRSP